MNDTPHDDTHAHDARHEARKNDARQRAMAQSAPASNNGAKWLAGAAAAAVLLGGGYYALKNMPANQPATEVASVDSGYGATSSTSPYVTTPTTGATIDTAGVAPADATVTTTETKSSSSPPARRRTTTTTTTAAATVPEEVVGVTPASLTTTGDNSDEIVVTAGKRPIWASRPSARRLSALYPERALERGREGEASVHCTVLDGGSLDCVRTSEYPTNAGFGNAALRVASRYKHAPQLADGSTATGTPVNLRVIFRIADNDRRRG